MMEETADKNLLSMYAHRNFFISGYVVPSMATSLCGIIFSIYPCPILVVQSDVLLFHGRYTPPST
jgi:hypothetical protein